MTTRIDWSSPVKPVKQMSESEKDVWLGRWLREQEEKFLPKGAIRCDSCGEETRQPFVLCGGCALEHIDAKLLG